MQTNSFQVVIVSDGELSFVFFSFGDIQWHGNAFIGFNLGGSRIFSLPGSQSPAAVDIETRSNVGVPGLFVYRVDQANVIEPNGNISTGSTLHYIVNYVPRKQQQNNNNNLSYNDM